MLPTSRVLQEVDRPPSKVSFPLQGCCLFSEQVSELGFFAQKITGREKLVTLEHPKIALCPGFRGGSPLLPIHDNHGVSLLFLESSRSISSKLGVMYSQI